MNRGDLREMREHTSVHYWPGPSNDLKEPDWYEIGYDLALLAKETKSNKMHGLARLALERWGRTPYEP